MSPYVSALSSARELVLPWVLESVQALVGSLGYWLDPEFGCLLVATLVNDWEKKSGHYQADL